MPSDPNSGWIEDEGSIMFWTVGPYRVGVTGSQERRSERHWGLSLRRTPSQPRKAV